MFTFLLQKAKAYRPQCIKTERHLYHGRYVAILKPRVCARGGGSSSGSNVIPTQHRLLHRWNGFFFTHARQPPRLLARASCARAHSFSGFVNLRWPRAISSAFEQFFTDTALAGMVWRGIDLSVTQWVGEVWHQRDVTLFFLDLERDGMDGGGHENHDFSMTYFLDAPIR